MKICLRTGRIIPAADWRYSKLLFIGRIRRVAGVRDAGTHLEKSGPSGHQIGITSRKPEVMSTHRSMLLVLALSMSFPAFAQQASLYSIADEKSERENVVRSLLILKKSEETIFWPLYEQYARQIKPASFNVPGVPDQPDELNAIIGEAFRDHYENIRTRKDYFEKINSAINGTIALKFLQSEALSELMHKSKYCERNFGDRLVWDKRFITDEQLKFDHLTALMDTSPEFAEKIRLIFDDFEFEYSRVVGHQFVWFELFVEEPFETTPAQCRKIGAEFLQQQHNEIKVAERFFKRLASETNEKFAATFIMLEDYFNTMAKLEIWSDLVLATR